MKNFIIIEHEPLTVRLKKIWNVDALKQKGVHVEYWDLSQYIFPKAVFPNVVEDDCIRRVTNIDEFNKLLSQADIAKSVFVLEIFPKWDNRNIILLLNKYRCYCVKIDLYANAVLYTPLLNRIIARIKAITPQKIVKKLSWIFLCKKVSIRLYEKVLSSSKIVSPDVMINHPDYEEYVWGEKKVPNVSVPYTVFIDSYFPLHPDILNLTSKKGISATEYRDLMKRFFDYWEEKYSTPVVIAAHPKSKYKGDEFGHRTIIKGKTPLLIENARMVITHESASLSYITLSDKPFVVVYPGSYKKCPAQYRYVNGLAKTCGKVAYNLNDCNWDDICVSPLDKEHRDAYIYTYLTSKKTQDRKNVDIWMDALLKEY